MSAFHYFIMCVPDNIYVSSCEEKLGGVGV